MDGAALGNGELAALLGPPALLNPDLRSHRETAAFLTEGELVPLYIQVNFKVFCLVSIFIHITLPVLHLCDASPGGFHVPCVHENTVRVQDGQR